MEFGRIRIWLGSFSGRHHALMLRLWAVALLVPAMLAVPWSRTFRLFSDRPVPAAVDALTHPARIVLAAVLAAWTLLLLFLPSFSFWYSFRFRYFAWMATRALASVRLWLARASWLALLVLAVYWQRDALLHAAKIPWLTLLGEASTAALLLAVMAGALRARRSIMILPFKDYTGDAALAAAIPGLAASLRSELAAIAMVYRVIDEAWSNPKGSSDLMPRVEQVGDSLQSGVAPEAKISFGFVNIPLGAMVAAFSHLVQGPRLTVSVHREGADLVLTAELHGGGRMGSWIVRPADMDDPERPAERSSPFPPLVEQLAYRLATELMVTGSTRWRAVRDYTQGLNTYRLTQHTQPNRNLLLRSAEKSFLRARKEDNQFAQCHYNLAVVYGQLGQPESVLDALHNALREGQATSQVFHALAVAYYNSGMFDEAIRFFDNALRKEPWRADTWRWKAFTMRTRRTQQVGRQPDESDEVWPAILKHRETATALAWRALCRSRLRGDRERRTLEEAARCVTDLAVGYAQISIKRYQRSERLFRQALHLTPDNAKPLIEIAHVLTAAGRWSQALDSVDNAIDNELDAYTLAVLRLCALACNVALHARTGQSAYETASEFAFLRLLDCLTKGQDETLGALTDWSRIVDLAEYQVRLRAASVILDLLRQGGDDVPGGQEPAAAHDLQRLDRIAAGLADLRRAAGESATGYLHRLGQAGRMPGAEAGPEHQAAVEDDLRPLRETWALWAVQVEHAESVPTGNTLTFLRSEADQIDLELLREAYRRISHDGAPRGQGRTEKRYEAALDENLRSLLDRLAEHQSPAGLVSGHEESRSYTIQVATFEDKVLQRAVGIVQAHEAKLARITVDWDWADAQLQIHRARVTPMSDPAAVQALEEALRLLNTHGFYQVRTLGLHGLLADVHIANAAAGHDARDHRVAALRHAEQEVASDPLQVWGRRRLGQAHYALSDDQRAEDEWLRCLDLNPDDAETVRSIAGLYWDRGVFACSSDTRRAAFQKVIELLERALALLASERLGTANAATQLESYGWIHQWLGRFYADIMNFEDGARHQRIALAMGFKPIEARVMLGAVYHDASAYVQAERELRSAIAEAYRQSRGRGTRRPADAPGEEISINELLATAYADWALLIAELGVDLEHAERLVRFAHRRIERLTECEDRSPPEVTAVRRRELRSSCHEARAAILLARQDFPGSLQQCESALALAPRSGPWLLLARVCLAGASDGTLDPEPARERASTALRHSRASDLRGLYAAEITRLESSQGTASGRSA